MLPAGEPYSFGCMSKCAGAVIFHGELIAFGRLEKGAREALINAKFMVGTSVPLFRDQRLCQLYAVATCFNQRFPRGACRQLEPWRIAMEEQLIQ